MFVQGSSFWRQVSPSVHLKCFSLTIFQVQNSNISIRRRYWGLQWVTAIRCGVYLIELRLTFLKQSVVYKIFNRAQFFGASNLIGSGFTLTLFQFFFNWGYTLYLVPLNPVPVEVPQPVPRPQASLKFYPSVGKFVPSILFFVGYAAVQSFQKRLFEHSICIVNLVLTAEVDILENLSQFRTSSCILRRLQEQLQSSLSCCPID